MTKLQQVPDTRCKITKAHPWLAITLPSGPMLHVHKYEPRVEAWHAAAETRSDEGHEKLLATLKDASEFMIRVNIAAKPGFKTSRDPQVKALYEKLSPYEKLITEGYTSYRDFKFKEKYLVALISQSQGEDNCKITIEDMLKLAFFEAHRSTKQHSITHDKKEPNYSFRNFEVYDIIKEFKGVDYRDLTKVSGDFRIEGFVQEEMLYHLHREMKEVAPYSGE